MAAHALKRMFAQINKTESQPDGTLKVWGFASAGCVDSDGETITPEAMKAALPDYMAFGAVREMHQPFAAGTAIEASVEEATGKTFFGAHIVDPVAVLKVQTGVYKGFSIGGKVTERDTMNKSVIKALKLVEISLVDRPANPEAVFTMYKADKTADRTPEDDITDLAAILDKGEVTPAQVLAYIADAQKAALNPVEPLVAVEAVLPAADADALRTKAAGNEVKKGMYSVSRFADLLCSVGSLAEDTNWEAEYEGDSSPIPAELRAWLQTGMTIFMAMAAEEAAELVSTLGAAAAETEVMVMRAASVAKAGAKYSSATKAVLEDVHKMLTSGCEKMAGLGYKADDDTVESSAGVEVTKSVDDTVGIVVEAEAVVKVLAPLADDLQKVSAENTLLKAELAALKKQPAPGKALLKSLTITKGADSNPDTETAPAPAAPAEGTQARAEYEMKKVFSIGGRALL